MGSSENHTMVKPCGRPWRTEHNLGETALPYGSAPVGLPDLEFNTICSSHTFGSLEAHSTSALWNF